MGTMTVVALCGFRVAELRDFSVIRVEVGERDVFVAPPALCHDVELETLLVSAPNRVCTVAIIANRKLLVAS